MNQGLNCNNIKVWWIIRDFIEEIKYQGPNWKNTCDCRDWNWLNKGSNWRKLKVWLLIKGLNAQTRNHGPRWKWHWTLGLMIEFDMGEIAWN